MSPRELLDTMLERIERDLRTRFPTIALQVTQDEDGYFVCDVTEENAEWGVLGGWDLSPGGDEPTLEDVEGGVASIAQEIADNLWPDELTEPWPQCPERRDHPLHPTSLVGTPHGRAFTMRRWQSLSDRLDSDITAALAVGHHGAVGPTSRRSWRRMVGVIKTPPWNKLGPYYPDRILDGGRDAPLGRRARWAWMTLMALIVGLGVLLVVLSR